jgi:hypothetical protein
MSGVVTVPELLDGHTVLDIECLDRICLNGYVPKLQAGGQVITFLPDHPGMPIVSPAVFEQTGTRFRRAVARFADDNGIPVIKFKKGIRKAAVMEPLLRRAAAAGRSRVAAIGWAQEFQPVREARKARHRPGQAPAVPLRQGRAPRDLLLLLRLGRVPGGRVHQGLRVLPVPGQGLAQRS